DNARRRSPDEVTWAGRSATSDARSLRVAARPVARATIGPRSTAYPRPQGRRRGARRRAPAWRPGSVRGPLGRGGRGPRSGTRAGFRLGVVPSVLKPKRGGSRLQINELIDPGCRSGGIARAVPMADHGRGAGGGVTTVAPSAPQDQPGDHSMSDTSTPAGRPTRRQFVKRVAGTAGCAIAPPAIRRGRDLHHKLKHTLNPNRRPS